MNSIDFYRFKGQSAAIPPFVILRFDFQYSAVYYSAFRSLMWGYPYFVYFKQY